MLDAILRAAGLRSVAAGNVGLPMVEAVMDPAPYDVFAVELSSFQLHYTVSMSAEAAVVLNVAEDHLDWYDGPAAWRRTPPTRAASTTRAEGLRLQRRRPRDRAAGPRGRRRARRPRVGFTLGMPAVGMVGVVDDILVDRAFIAERQSSAAELCTVDDLASPAPHVVANALAAAALARAHGVPQAAVRDGLRFRLTATGSRPSPAGGVT